MICIRMCVYCSVIFMASILFACNANERKNVFEILNAIQCIRRLQICRVVHLKKFSPRHKLMPQSVFHVHEPRFFFSALQASPTIHWWYLFPDFNVVKIALLYTYKFLNVHQFNSTENIFIATIFCQFNTSNGIQRAYTHSHSVVLLKNCKFSNKNSIIFHGEWNGWRYDDR